MAVLVTKWFGIFLIDEKTGKIIEKRLMPKDPNLIAERLALVQRGSILEEEKELAGKLPKISVSNTRQSGLGRPMFYDSSFLDPKSFGFTEEIMHSAMLGLGKLRTSEPVPKDRNLVHAIRGLDDLIESTNLLNERLHEWYGMHFPELADVAKDERYAALISELGDRDSIIKELGLDISSIGSDFADRDLKETMDLAETVIRLYEEKERMEQYITEIATGAAPNMCAIIDAPLSARLISLAGGLDRLSTLPSSTVQLLGAEKAMFRHLRSGKRPPKHGVIYQHPDIHRSPYWQRGKIARALAGKVLIAAKIDANRGEFIGDKLKEEFAARVKDIQERYPEAPKKQQSQNRPNKKRGNRPRR
ncbi:putative NOP5 family protein [Candidatus Methanoplasma termitum]|uniref:Putative NOP5 family protein n=1 Tax=Candidatus Methanoplasma termitum TaxID=1577791 RepID=A0A0A7LFB1_9ARCH|nr:ribosomal biogenesis protein [Candidatus Methanoplasma termitum]AIZ56987.1 putative NOP5 family protein [Candidatus Methanoplasma termitum]MCL2334110.1 ribosomal biogenesis protein [Candidatus Methanoplasma sp.]